MLNLRRYLLAGLVVTIPIGVTLYILNAVYSLLQQKIGVPVENYLADHLAPVTVRWPWIAGAEPLVAVVVGAVLTLALILLVGLVSSTVVGRRAVQAGEALVERVPVVGRIYTPARQAVQLLFSTQKTAFRRVVMVQYPLPGSYCIGFVTSETWQEAVSRAGKKMVNVFIPFSPTPVTGIVLLVAESDLFELSMTVEQGMKLVISGGVLTPDSEAMGNGEGSWANG